LKANHNLCDICTIRSGIVKELNHPNIIYVHNSTKMNQKQFDIFLSAFFSDKKKIDGLVDSESDLGLTFEISNASLWSGTRKFHFSVLDILQMNLDCWHSLKDCDILKTTGLINPKIFYQNCLESFENVLNRFPDLTYDGIQYDKYISLIMCFDDDDNWLDENEIKEYEAEGYRRIDLELINYGARRNAKKVIELLDNGANANIDPDDRTFESEILDLLGSAESYHFINIVSFHVQKISKGYNDFKMVDSNYLISELFATASSAKLYSIINDRLKEKSNH
jgi:hypothetical protein